MNRITYEKIITDAQLRKIVKETVSDKDVSCGLGLVLRIRGAKQTWRVSFVITDPNTPKKKKHLSATLGEYADISLKKALNLAVLKKQELTNNYSKVKTQEYTFNDLKDEWIDDLHSGGTSKKRTTNIKTHLKKLANFGFLDKKINSITTEDFIDYTRWAKSRNDSMANIKLTLKNLIQFIKYISSCNRCEYMVYCKFKELYSSPKYKVPKSEGYSWKHLSQLHEHLFAPLDNKDLIVRAGILLVAMTGLRLNSAINMRWDWIDTKQNIITIPKDFMKIKHDFELPITDYMARFFTNWYNLTSDINTPKVE
ncbi:MAG: integrase family protein [Succinivibrionaceae bacterium]|nr:integrase family protein [Succinivibrionaceae bacterium]